MKWKEVSKDGSGYQNHLPQMTLHETLSAEERNNCFVLERNIDTKTSLRHQRQHHFVNNEACLFRFSHFYSTPFTIPSLPAYEITLSDHHDVNREGVMKRGRAAASPPGRDISYPPPNLIWVCVSARLVKSADCCLKPVCSL